MRSTAGRIAEGALPKAAIPDIVFVYDCRVYRVWLVEHSLDTTYNIQSKYPTKCPTLFLYQSVCLMSISYVHHGSSLTQFLHFSKIQVYWCSPLPKRVQNNLYTLYAKYMSYSPVSYNLINCHLPNFLETRQAIK
jgi:hypothetical protein